MNLSNEHLVDLLNEQYEKVRELEATVRDASDVIVMLKSIILHLDNKYLEDHRYIIDTSQDFLDSLKKEPNDN